MLSSVINRARVEDTQNVDWFFQLTVGIGSVSTARHAPSKTTHKS